MFESKHDASVTTSISAPKERLEIEKPEAGPRPEVRGKFIYSGDKKLWIKGVSFGTFRPDEHGEEFHDRNSIERDFAQIAAAGFNAVRTYTIPPRWLLDAACRNGLRVMVGLPWEQHIAFLDDPRRTSGIRERVRAGVRACAGHSAVLCYAIGNEIPADIARWYGARRIERFLRTLCSDAKTEDPGGLFTYVNYPSTEYLELPFVDLVCFNVYLESQERLASYIARLQNLAGDRPLVLAEIGLDSLRNGLETQSNSLGRQLRTVFAEGAAGAFVFSWTDEWHRGGHDITDWDFGLTDRNREPKPALAAVTHAFKDIPFGMEMVWPRISVVVCSYNGARTIRDCCEGLLKLEYPDFEVIVVDDGSTDATAAIATEYGFRVISTENLGLSNARNTGLAAAQGEIVAYTDDDAYPDPHWLSFLASTFLNSDHAGVGGPNIPPTDGGAIAECVANAPGGPVHVLLSDREAEHIPGCNMAFWKDKLEAIGGFDPRYRAAGDDVDVCWRLQQRGWTLGFSPAAVVWHHRRNSVRAYWKQQKGYGKAEALLEAKWPERYNSLGHVNWAGSVYGVGSSGRRGRLGRIFYGVWGSSPFQSIYQPATGMFASLPSMPEWYLMTAALAVLSVLGGFWKPLLAALPLAVFAAGASVTRAFIAASTASFTHAYRHHSARWKLRAMTAFLCLLQPLARLIGRLSSGLTPWRRRGVSHFALPFPIADWVWSERWRSLNDRLHSFEANLRESGVTVFRGGNFDRWDLEVRDGTLCSVRIHTTVEEHGAGRQLVRFRLSPRCSRIGRAGLFTLAVLSVAAALDHAWEVFMPLAVLTIYFAGKVAHECAVATGVVISRINEAKMAEAEAIAVPLNPVEETRAAHAAHGYPNLVVPQAKRVDPGSA